MSVSTGIQKTNNKPVNWQQIETVLLDMDGTLLDKHFDDYFWEQYVPEHYSLKNKITVAEAKDILLAKYKRQEGKLAWTDLDYWSNELGLDIPILKIKIDHLIKVHPYVIDFLTFCKENAKKIYLVSNAHGKTLDIKMKKTDLGPFFDGIVLSADIGMAKEDPLFWKKLQVKIRFDPERTLLADDTEKVLQSAKEYGMKHLIFIAKSSSRGTVTLSDDFISIYYFNELIDYEYETAK